MRYLLLLIFLQIGFSIGAQTLPPITVGSQLVNLSPDAQYLEDATGTLTIEQVLQEHMNAKFKPVGSSMVNFGLTTSVFWVRVHLKNNTGERVIVELGNNALTDIKFYETIGGKVVKQFHTGNWVPFAKREIKNVNYLFPLAVETGGQTVVYVRAMHYRGTQFQFKAGTLTAHYETDIRRSILEGMYYGFMLLMVLYNLFLFFSLRDRAYLFYVIYIFFMALLNATINGFAFRYLWPSYPLFNQYDDIIAAFAGSAGILFASTFLNTRKNAPVIHKVFLVLLAVYLAVIILILSGGFHLGVIIIEVNSLLLVISFFLAAYQTLRNGYKPAKFFLIAWSFLLVSVIIFILNNFDVIPPSWFATHSIQIGSAVEALLLAMALANRINVYKEERRKAQLAAFHSLEKNKKLIVEQNMMLERKVEERTAELQNANNELVMTLQNLKETQAQLVQKEKMASLGELTAGIAHEIQNPLNFVNNFSDISTELVDELKQEMENAQSKTARLIVDDLEENLKKILYHGRRADSIVKGMLQHSRLNKGNREAINLNTMVDESLRLAYYSLRAKDGSFTAITETHYDEGIGNVEVVAQDMGRVLLNIFNNAFYAVCEKKKQLGGSYQPVIAVSTRKQDDMVTICIRDNGVGIPQNVQSKIYQPFFTTKPAGEGTGLGLSLSYDIITKDHGGTLHLDTKEGQYAEFLIQLPLNSEV